MLRATNLFLTAALVAAPATLALEPLAPAAMLAAAPAAIAPDDAATQRALDAAFEELPLRGVACVARKGEVVAHAAAGGVAPGDATPGELSTPYPLASLTKLYTQACVLRLVAEGELALDDRVALWLGAVVPPGLTVRHLLEGRSGFPRELAEDPRDSGVVLDEQGRVFPWLVRRGPLPTEVAPGEREHYSNVDAWVLGALVENLTDEPFADAFARLVAEPIGLRDTGFVDALGARVARGVLRDAEGEGPSEPVDFARRYTSGGMASSARDLAAMCAALHDADLFGLHGFAVLGAGDGLLVIGGVLPGHTNALLHDFKAGVTVVLLDNTTIEPPDVVLGALAKLAETAGARPPSSGAPRRKLVVESAAGGLPDAPLCRAATAFDEAMRAADRAAVQRWLETHSTMGEDPADADALFGLRDELDGWSLVGYLERSPDELFLVARGENDVEVRLTFVGLAGDPGRVEDVMLEFAPRGR